MTFPDYVSTPKRCIDWKYVVNWKSRMATRNRYSPSTLVVTLEVTL